MKDLFAQPMSGKFMRGHFSDRSESFRKVTKPSRAVAVPKRYSIYLLSPPGFALSLISREEVGVGDREDTKSVFETTLWSQSRPQAQAAGRLRALSAGLTPHTPHSFLAPGPDTYPVIVASRVE